MPFLAPAPYKRGGWSFLDWNKYEKRKQAWADARTKVSGFLTTLRDKTRAFFAHPTTRRVAGIAAALAAVAGAAAAYRRRRRAAYRSEQLFEDPKREASAPGDDSRRFLPAFDHPLNPFTRRRPLDSDTMSGPSFADPSLSNANILFPSAPPLDSW